MKQFTKRLILGMAIMAILIAGRPNLTPAYIETSDAIVAAQQIGTKNKDVVDALCRLWNNTGNRLYDLMRFNVMGVTIGANPDLALDMAYWLSQGPKGLATANALIDQYLAEQKNNMISLLGETKGQSMWESLCQKVGFYRRTLQEDSIYLSKWSPYSLEIDSSSSHNLNMKIDKGTARILKGLLKDKLPKYHLANVDIPKDQVRRIQDLKDAFKMKDVRQREVVPSAAGLKEQASLHVKNLGKLSLVAWELPPKARTDLNKIGSDSQVIRVNAQGNIATPIIRFDDKVATKVKVADLPFPLPKPTADQVTIRPPWGMTRGKLAINPQPIPLPQPAVSQAKIQKASHSVAVLPQPIPRPVNTAALGRR